MTFVRVRAPSAVVLIATVLFSSGCAVDARSGEAPAQDAEELAFEERSDSAAPFPHLAFAPLDLPKPDDVRTASGAPGPAYWQQKADYAIEATLDADARRLNAKAVITYANRSPETLTYLWLHLEQNLFRDDSLGRTVFGAERRFGSRGGGGFEIGSIRANGVDLAYAVYDTLARVELPRPIAPREGVFVFEIVWSFAIPEQGVDRLGVEKVGDGPIFQIAQWFPAVVKFDDVRGWNALPYLGPGEFYTDFGDYDVALTVPRTHLVGATGVLTNPEDVLTATQRERLAAAARSRATVSIVGARELATGAARPSGEGPTTWRFKARDCRSFAWASSPAFLWDEATTKTGVRCRSLYPREALPAWRAATDDLAYSIEVYSELLAPYPYPDAVNVNGRVGGMEYPGIVFCSERKDPEQLWLVTTHEIGHAWFPMLVNTDERRHAWMDEGFNTFVNALATDRRYPDAKRSGPFRGLLSGWFEHLAFREFMTGAERRACDTPPDRMPPPQVAWSQYAVPAVGLAYLRDEILGPKRFDAAFKEYVALWSFKSPRPADFFRCMENAAGADLAWFWRGWLLEPNVVDQEAFLVEVKPDGAAVFGFRNRGMPTPIVVRATWSDGATETFRIPVETFATTDVVEKAFRPEARRRVVGVLVDPEKRAPDVRRDNDEATVDGRRGSGT